MYAVHCSGKAMRKDVVWLQPTLHFTQYYGNHLSQHVHNMQLNVQKQTYPYHI